MIYVTSDLHFFHANAIKYGDRPYQSWQEMNEGLIANWTGGAYTAWNLEPWEVPGEIGCGDLICGAFWEDNKLICGKGDTPDEAKRALIRKLRG